MVGMYKRILSIIVVISMLLPLLSTQRVIAEEKEQYPYTIFAASNKDGSIYFDAGNICVNGSICTNGTIVSENSMNVNGNKIEHAMVDMPDLWIWLSQQDLTEKSRICDEDIILKDEVRLNNKDIIVTKSGNINVDSDNVDLNGLIYAPEGNITITAQNLNMNSVILIANKVTIRSSNININYNQLMAEKMVWSKNDQKQDFDAQHRVCFDLMGIGNKEISDQLVDAGALVTEPEIPECDEYMFLGWYLDKEYKEWFDFSKCVITQDTILYAKWYNLTDDTDTDGDGLEDEYERLIGTDPQQIDTDKDGLSDYVELFYNFDIDPCKKDTNENGITDGDEDADQDGLSNIREIEIGTEMNCSDTDGDGLTDGEEVDVYHTNPLAADTDNDMLSDRKEIMYGTDPLKFNSTFDIVAHVNKEDVEFADIDITIKINNITGEQAEAFSVEPNTSETLFPKEMPGYMGCAYDLTMLGKFRQAELTFKFDQVDDEVEPCIYYFNEDEQDLIPLDTTIEGNTASTITTHFSTYVLLDKKKYEGAMTWMDPWDATQYTDAQVVLLTDDSSSMRKNDRYDMRLSVAATLIDDMPQNCKASIVSFSSDYERLCAMTDNRKKLKSYLSDGYFFSYGNTRMNTALLASLDYFTSDATDTTLKMIVLLSDGQATDRDKSAEIVKKANKEGIKIYCVGLGSGSYSYFNSYLRPLAEKTGGTFYYASNASDLKKIYADITDKIDLNTDSDQDGLSDYYEDRLPAFNGVKLKLNKNKKDTDGDGLLDGEEITEVKYVYNKNKTKVRIYGKMKSNPTKIDSDGDGLLDNSAVYSNGVKIAPCDPTPLQKNGKNNIWNIHIAQMKKGRIGTSYQISKTDKIINRTINKVREICPEQAIYVKGKLEQWSREFIIDEKDNMDELLLKYKKEVREVVWKVKKHCGRKIAAAVGAAFLNFSYDNLNDAYHAMPITWQKKYGYNKLYDDVFKVGSNMNKSTNNFTYKGQNYALWFWKGDYWSLGTGAEIGLYVQSKESATHYDGVGFTLPMELSLYQYKNGLQVENRYNWRPDAEQWWITGFDPMATNPKPDRLVSIGRIDFSRNREMGQAIYDKKKADFDDMIYDNMGQLWIVWR